MKKETVPCIISCKPISSSLISIRVSAKPHNITIIQVYAPTSDYDDLFMTMIKSKIFYKELDKVIKDTLRKISHSSKVIGMQKWEETHMKIGQEQQDDFVLEKRMTGDFVSLNLQNDTK